MIPSTGLFGELRNIARQIARTNDFLTWPERRRLGLAILLMALVGYVAALIPITLGMLVDRIIREEISSIEVAFELLAILAISYLAREVFQVMRKILVEGTCTAIECRANVSAISTILRLDLSAFQHEKAGALNGRVGRSVSGMVRLLKLSFLDFFPALFGAGFALSAAIGKNALVGLVMGGIVPIGLLIIVYQLSSQRGVRIALLASREQMDGTVVEQIGGIETVRAANAFGQEIGKVTNIAEKRRQQEFRHHIFMAGFDAAKSLIEGGFHIGVVTLAIWLALEGNLSTGDILAVSLLFGAVVAPLREIHRIIDEAHESSINAEKFFELLARSLDRSFVVEEAIVDLERNPIVEADALSVVYDLPVGRERVALANVSLVVRRGEVVGLAGPTGSGKTTFVRALLRLAHPKSGRLSIAGMPVECMSRSMVRQCFGFVGQSPTLFAGSVADNIAFGSHGAHDDDIRRAAALARIDREIEAFPGGYRYEVGERGANLSGGQRQRIAIARIFLQNPPILILDEATSALDNQNEAAVMDAIAEIMTGRTVIMIAHRLSSLRRANRIVVFRSGQIVEEGEFAELLSDPNSEFSAIARETADANDSSSDQFPSGAINGTGIQRDAAA